MIGQLASRLKQVALFNKMRKLFFFISSLLIAVAFASCGQTKNTADGKDSTILTLGVLPTIDCLPFYYADSVGLFDFYGLKMNLVTFDAAMDADTAFMNGCIDGIVTDWVKACIIWNGNTDSVPVAMVGELRLWLVAASESQLQNTENLKEKIIGVTRHSSIDYFADKILASAKLNSIDLNKPQINNIKLRALMVDQNQYDGAILPEPYASEAVAKGAKRLGSTMDFGVEGLMCVLFNDSVYKTRKEEMQKIKDVYDAAVRALNADSISNRLSYMPQSHRQFIHDTLFQYTTLNPSTQPNDSITQDIKSWAKGRGLIK